MSSRWSFVNLPQILMSSPILFRLFSEVLPLWLVCVMLLPGIVRVDCFSGAAIAFDNSVMERTSRSPLDWTAL